MRLDVGKKKTFFDSDQRTVGFVFSPYFFIYISYSTKSFRRVQNVFL